MLKRTSISTWLAVVLVAGLWPAPVSAQSFYGSLLTVVQDDQGGVLPGATVLLVSESTGERREAVSGADGTARFVNLVPGAYRLEVLPPEGLPFTSEPVEVRAGRDGTVVVDLPAAAPIEQTITVTAPAYSAPEEVKNSGYLVAPRALIRIRYNAVRPVMYSVRPSSPQPTFVSASGGRIVPRCVPSGAMTRTPPGPVA